MKLLRTFLATFVLAVFAGWGGIASAELDAPFDAGAKRALGAVLEIETESAGTSIQTLDWGFVARYVRVCVITLGATPGPIFVRIVDTLTDSTGVVAADATGYTISATDSSAFRVGGGDTSVPGQAVPLFQLGEGGNDDTCYTLPWAVTALTFHYESGGATIAVWAVK